MFNKKYISVLLVLTLIFTLSTAVMAHGGSHHNSNNNNYNNNYNDNQNNNNQNYGPGMMGNNNYGQGHHGQGYGMNCHGFNNGNSIGNQYNKMMGTMMGQGMMVFNNNSHSNNHFGMMNNYNRFMNNYGPRVNNRKYQPGNINMNRDKVIELSQELVRERYGDQFIVMDMIVYSNSPYYLVVKEKNDQKAAFGLMFDPVRQVVYPEYGPNMMWNRNYGMGFMMGMNNQTAKEQIDKEEALANARNFAQNNGLNVRNDAYQFSGYYSFYVENNNQLLGLVSVNAYSGEVWAHNWHGNLIEKIEVEN